MTDDRLAEIREEISKGSWGFLERKHKQLPNATGRLWFGKSENNFYYSAWVDEDPERMKQLIHRANMVDELFIELEAAKKELNAFTSMSTGAGKKENKND